MMSHTFRVRAWAWVILCVLLVLLPQHKAVDANQGLLDPQGIIKAPYELFTDDLLNGAKIQFASPALGDLDHDAYKEIVVGTSDGWVYAIKPDTSQGTLLWSFNTKNALNALARYSTDTTIRGTPALADLDGDGWNEVVVPVGTVFADGENGGVVVLAHDGTLKAGWPQLTYDRREKHHTAGVPNSPALGDLDGDGDLEVVVGAFDHRVYAWHHDGTLVAGWPRHVQDTIWSSPALGDLDKDGRMEVVIGVDAHEASYFGTPNGGGLYVFHDDGKVMAGFPRYINDIFISSPALADLDSDGYLDIIVGAGDYYKASDGKKVHVWDRFGQYLPGWPVTTGGYVNGSPAVADLDNNGDLEVVVGSLDEKIYAWHHTGSVMWSMTPKQWTGAPIKQRSVVVVDIDDDGDLDVLTNNSWEVAIVNSSGAQVTWDGADPNSGALSYYTSYTIGGVPSVGDIDNDGKYEIVVGGAAPGGATAAVYAWELTDSDSTDQALDWPVFKHNAARTGNMAQTQDNDAVIVRHTLPEHLLVGQSYDADIVFRNTGHNTWSSGAAYRLGITAPDFVTSNRMNLSSDVAPGQDVTFTFTLDAPSAPGGFYPIELRMVQDGVEWFGQKVVRQVKVGNQAALQVLYAASGSGGVFPGGLASALTPPSEYSSWQNASAFALTKDKAGYYLLDEDGGYVTWAGTAVDVGSLIASPAVDIVLAPDGEGYYFIDAYGKLNRPSSGIDIYPLPPTFGDKRMRSLAVTPDTQGVYVLDKNGAIYTGGTAVALSPSTPTFTKDIALKIKLTADAKGYYVLDQYGRVHNGGTAPALTAQYTIHDGEDWARDFELTADGEGYYLLDKSGNIHTGGTAEPLTVNLPPVVTDGSAIDLELADSRILKQPLLTSSIEALTFMMAYGDPLPSRQMTIQNSGAGGALTWAAAVTSGDTWLAVSPTSGTTPATIDLSVTQAMTLGIHTGTVVITATDQFGAAVPEQSVSLSLLVVDTVHAVYLPAVLKN